MTETWLFIVIRLLNKRSNANYLFMAQWRGFNAKSIFYLSTCRSFRECKESDFILVPCLIILTKTLTLKIVQDTALVTQDILDAICMEIYLYIDIVGPLFTTTLEHWNSHFKISFFKIFLVPYFLRMYVRSSEYNISQL